MGILMIEDKIAKLVNLLDIPEEFGISDYDELPNYDMEYELWRKITPLNARKYESPLRFYCAFGASKAVIVPDASSWVIKIPFYGRLCVTENWNEETEEYDVEDEYFAPFEYAEDGFGTSDWDYCDNELAKYHFACERGLGDFFATTKFYGENHHHPIYIQEKAQCLDDCLGSHPSSEKARKIYEEEFKDSEICLDREWVSNAIDWFGTEKVIEFFNFLIEFKYEYANDLHRGNVGYALDGRPVLIDFSGWRD